MKGHATVFCAAGRFLIRHDFRKKELTLLQLSFMIIYGHVIMFLFVSIFIKTEIKQEEDLEYAKKKAVKWDGSETADTAMWRVGKRICKK